MTTVQFDEEAIYHVARLIADPEARDAYLCQVCGDDAARRDRLDALLRVCDLEPSFLEPLPLDATVELTGPTEREGAAIGPYRLMEQIGEGGMGVVFMAEQHEPVRRRVALKVIKPGMDTRQVVARFEAERQALALMDHPNIARVHDGGATPEGRPYFVMELVRGIPITDYCDRERLSVPERLELFVLVCRAVQHAHQKGVIHRDLKPSNILVTLIDGVAVPKVIDFGVAKATGGALTDRTLFTGFHQLVGTPLYMSPEQVDLSGVDVDTRSDVYALGVLLYELLTGTTPIGAERFRQAAFDEMRRLVREAEPPTPSTRLATLDAERRSGVSAARHADPRHLGRSLRGELDWIVMRALEKDRRRRYETANALAADVLRHLADEPVEAYPPSARYRFAKFARRNRAALVTGLLVALALAAGAGVSAWQAVEATRARRLAEARSAMARRAVDDMYTQVAEEWLRDQPALTTLQRDFLEKALSIYEQFAAEPGSVPEVQAEVVRALHRVGAIRSKLKQLARAEASLRRAVEQAAELTRNHPQRPEFLLGLAEARIELVGVYEAMGKPFQGDIGRRVATSGGVVEFKTTVRRDHGSEAEREALQAAREIATLKTAPLSDASDRQRLAEVSGRLCNYLTRARHLPEAEEAMQAALETWEALARDFPSETEYRHGLARAFSTQGMQRMWWGRQNEGAEWSLRQAEERLTKLGAELPRHPRRRQVLGGTLINLAVLQGWAGRFAEAEDIVGRAAAVFEDLAADYPDVPTYAASFVQAARNLGMYQNDQGRNREAEETLREAVAAAEDLIERHPNVPEYQTHLIEGLKELVESVSQQDRNEEARQLAERAVRHARSLVEDHPGLLEARNSYTGALYLLQGLSHLLGDEPTAARAAEERARSLLTDIPVDDLDQAVATMLLDMSTVDTSREAQLREYDLQLMPAVEDVGDLPAEGRSRIILADIRGALHLQVFDAGGRLAVDIDEARLPGKRSEIAELSALLGGKWGRPRISPSDEDRVLAAVTAISRHVWTVGDSTLFGAMIREASRRGPDHARLLFTLADLLSTAPEEFRDPAQALDFAEKAFALEPDNDVARQSLGWARYRAGDWKGCIETLEKQESYPGVGDFVAAMAHWRLGDQAKAREIFDRADRWLPGYERRCEERSEEGTYTYPLPAMLRRFRTEAATLLGVETPDAEAKSSLVPAPSIPPG